MIDKLFNRSTIIRKALIRYYARKEGGVFRSPSIRRLYENNKAIKAGYASYGWTSDAIDGPAIIGNYTSIGKNVRRICVNHMATHATTHPVVFNPVLGWVDKDPRERKLIKIGNDVWIGDNVTILPSCTFIGDGAIVAAGAVVSKNIPPYEIWGGVPARCIKRRFPDDIVKGLEEVKWWELPEEELRKIKTKFENPLDLIETIKKKSE